MHSKSSTALALISILSILIVLFIALSNVEDSPVRKPFPSAGADETEEQEPVETVGAFDQDTSVEIVTAESKQENKLTDLVNNLVSDNIPDPTTDETDPAETELLTRNISNELLDKAGYRDFIVKPRPFDGQLFGLFDLNMLSYLDIVDKKITRIIDGNEVPVLRVYEFNFTDDASTQEIYDFLRAKIKDELGVTINETNQFGLSSFYINFQVPKDQAFLVVKTRTNVYALSYPKAKDGDLTYFELTSKLLSELI